MTAGLTKDIGMILQNHDKAQASRDWDAQLCAKFRAGRERRRAKRNRVIALCMIPTSLLAIAGFFFRR